MIIKSIHLQNYRRYENQLVELPNGLIGIVGKNGTGKSTLIEAIGWCLYGNNAARTDKDEIRRTGAGNNEDCKVSLEMILGEDTLRIERELRGTNSTGMAKIFVNGSSQAHVNGMLEVSNYIARRTGLDQTAFFTSVFAKQKELNALSDKQPGKRKETILKLLRIDTIDEVIMKIKSDIKGRKEKIDFIKPTLKDMDLLKKNLINLEEEKHEKQVEINMSTKEEKILENSVILAKQKFEYEEKKFKEHVKFDSLIQTLSGNKISREDSQKIFEIDLKKAKDSFLELEKINPQLVKYKKIKKEKESLDKQHLQFIKMNDLKKQLRKNNSDMSECVLQIKQIKNKLLSYKDIDRSIKHNQKNLNLLQKRKESLEKSINLLRGKAKELGSQKRKVEQEFSKITNLGKKSSCPTCKRPIGDHMEEIITHYREEISGLTEKIKATDSKRLSLEPMLEDLTNKIGIICNSQFELEPKKTLKIKLEGDLKSENKNFDRFNKQTKIFISKLKKFEGLTYEVSRHQQITEEFNALGKIREHSIALRRDVTRIPNLESRISVLVKLISNLEKQIERNMSMLKKINFDQSVYDSAKKSLESITTQHTQKKIDITQKNGELSQIIINIQQNNQYVIEEEQKQKMIETEEKMIASRSKLEKIMTDFKLDLISRIRPTLSSRASELFREITNGRYPGLELDEDYNIRIEDEGMNYGTNRFSGGEEDLANLCLRIAISQELSERSGSGRTSFIALDEIFGSQDEERKNNILKALSGLTNQFKQILIITHIDDIKEALPYVLNIIENTKETAKIVPEGIPA